ncbi:MAG: hypothetical protein RRA94_08945 [Bacteroidota bacterium]|nr:hypothetical protein [Bacteroidota bacterium]
MYRFYRLDTDENDKDFLTEIETCAIQGDRVPAIAKRFPNKLFYLGISDDNRIVVTNEFSRRVPKHLYEEVENFLNSAEDKRALPTYAYGHILLNNVDRVPHLKLVYIAESEEEVWAFINS